MSTFYITAVRYSSTNPQHIANVLVHSSAGNNRLTKGQERTKNQIIADLSNNTYRTAIYNYTDGCWNAGAQVSSVQISGVTYLRTVPDNTQRDNLGNLLHIDELK